MEDMTLKEKIEVAAEQIENSLEIGAKDERKQIRLILTHFAKELVNGADTNHDKALHKHFVSNTVLPHVSNSSDLDDDCVYCKDCGEEMEWQECWSCGGEGGRGWEDLQFEDPLWYSPDDFIECDECEGEGGMWICSNKNCG